jgi:tetratricopeptide (TPR) repeat protein
MVNAFAEELKARGNEAFAAKRFEDAIVLYDKAIEMDETNFVYYNNRAAAYHELKNYDRAIEEARKSISIENNPRAHARLGAALWAQGKLREAKGEFEVAAAMDPSNKAHKESMQTLEQLINPLPSSSGFANRRGVPHPYEYARAAAAANAAVPTHGGEFISVDCGPAGLALDVLVIFLTALFVLSSLFMPSMPEKLWGYLLIATMAQQALVMRARNLLQAKMDVLNSWMSHFCSLLFLLCFFALLIGVRPIIFMPIFIAAYSVLDVVNKRQQIAALLGPLYPTLAPYMQRVEDNKEQIRIFAGSVEALLMFTVMLTGGTFFTLAYIQYAKNRYNHDGYVKLAFKGLRMNITRLTTASFMPAVVDKYAQKLFDLLDKVAEQPI